jgi:transcriptional regulator with XRE-family HTH domain
MFHRSPRRRDKKKMGNVVRFPRERHARASSTSTTRKKSLAVTSPPVTAAIFSATSREGHPVPSQSAVIQPPVTPMDCANSPRLMDLDSKYSASFMTEMFSPTKNSAQVKVLVPLCGQDAAVHRNFSMAKRQARQEVKVQTRFKQPPFRPTFIRQWRKKRGLTLEACSERAGMSKGNLSNIETGKTGYSQATLEALADALQCDPVDLLVRNPSDPDGIWSLWDQAKPAQRKQLIGMIDSYLKAAAG